MSVIRTLSQVHLSSKFMFLIPSVAEPKYTESWPEAHSQHARP